MLNELLSEAVTETAWTPAQIADAVAAAKKTSEYHDLLAASSKAGEHTLYDVSSQVQTKRGTFEFAHDPDVKDRGRGKGIKRYYSYLIYSYGRLKYGASQLASYVSPSMTPNDLLENYKRLFQRIIDIRAAGSSKRNPPVREYAALADDKLSGFKERGDFKLVNSSVNTLEGAPKIVAKYSIEDCKNITTLKGGPVMITKFLVTVSNCPKLESLEGGPLSDVTTTTLSYALVRLPALKTLRGIAKRCMHIDLDGCGISSFEGISDYLKVCTKIKLDPSKVKSHVLGLALIDGLELDDIRPRPPSRRVNGAWELGERRDIKWFTIITDIFARFKHHDRLIELQHALIDADLEEYAKL